MAALRALPSGELDTSFGTDGVARVTIDVPDWILMSDQPSTPTQSAGRALVMDLGNNLVAISPK